MRWVGFISLALLAAALLLSTAAVRAPVLRHAYRTPTYSIIYHFVMTGGHGRRSEGDSYRGQDSNGNRVEAYPMRNIDRIIHFTRGIDVEVGKTEKSITTWGMGIPRMDEPPPPTCRDGDQTPIKPEEIKTMLGFEVVRDRNSIPDEWRALVLDCQPLWRRTDFNDGYTLEVATSASVKPVSSFFRLPENAVELSPREYRQSLGIKPVNARDAKGLELSMELYQREKRFREENLGLVFWKRWFALARRPSAMLGN